MVAHFQKPVSRQSMEMPHYFKLFWDQLSLAQSFSSKYCPWSLRKVALVLARYLGLTPSGWKDC